MYKIAYIVPGLPKINRYWVVLTHSVYAGDETTTVDKLLNVEVCVAGYPHTPRGLRSIKCVVPCNQRLDINLFGA